jgi:hypothetical protein
VKSSIELMFFVFVNYTETKQSFRIPIGMWRRAFNNINELRNTALFSFLPNFVHHVMTNSLLNIGSPSLVEFIVDCSSARHVEFSESFLSGI